MPEHAPWCEFAGEEEAFPVELDGTTVHCATCGAAVGVLEPIAPSARLDWAD